MKSFLAKRAGLGVEILSSSIRLAAVSRNGAGISALYVKSCDLPDGIVSESYAAPNVREPEKLGTVLREALDETAGPKLPRVALSLPDSVFRVQILEFDDLPSKRADCEHLVRWRLDKAAAFDTSDISVQYQVLRRRQKNAIILACAMKREVLAQYEAVITGLGLEPWVIGPSSFHTLNCYAAPVLNTLPASALAYVTGNSFVTIIIDNGKPDFYRFKDIKKTSPEEIHLRLVREIEDSLHFYTHNMDRSQSQLLEIKRLYLCGDYPGLARLSEGLKETSLEVELLSPASVLTKRDGSSQAPAQIPEFMAPAIGAGGALC